MAQKVALSFSGGKDSCLAFYELQQQGVEVASLLTTVWKENKQTVAHEEKLERIQEQAERLGIPLHFVKTDFSTYTDDFAAQVMELKKRYGIDGVAFGDIYLDGHREWGENVCSRAAVAAVYPLWTEKENALPLLQRFVGLGFRAEVIKADAERLPKGWEGRLVDDTFIADLQDFPDVCPMGESGEYHTYVLDGPIFD